MNWKEIIKKLPRYQNFTIVEDLISFNEMFKDTTIDVVQVHSVEVIADTIVGFCGVFKWDKNILTPLDGDSYFEKVKVLGYNWFDHDGDKCLDILVGDDW